jgi:hypothetical protein
VVADPHAQSLERRVRRTVDQQEEPGEEGSVQQRGLLREFAGGHEFRDGGLPYCAGRQDGEADDCPGNREEAERLGASLQRGRHVVLADRLPCPLTGLPLDQGDSRERGTPATSPPMTVSTRIFGV